MKTISLFIQIIGILGFRIQLVSAFLSLLDSDVEKQLQVWNMMLDFGELYKANGWILHYDQSHNSTTPWKLFYKTIIKESKNVEGYFAANDISDQHMHPSRLGILSNGIILHLYVSQNIHSLNQMLEDEMYLKQSFERGQNHSPSQHIWMIQMPQNLSNHNMIKVLGDLHLRYDTRSFCFTQTNKIDIYEVYKIDINSNVILKRIGNWAEKDGINISDHYIWKRRRSLQGYHFRVASI